MSATGRKSINGALPICASAVIGMALAPAAHGQVSTKSDLIMYGIDADTYELLRYEFRSDTFVRVGQVRDKAGALVTDVEGLAYIPSGLTKGFYGGANYYLNRPTGLARINPLDAKATVLNTTLKKVTGMVAVSGNEASPVTNFAVSGRTIVPPSPFGLRVSVLGAALTRGGMYTMPISFEVKVGNTTIEPWGPFTKAIAGNINNGGNPRQWVSPGTFPAGAAVSLRARAWEKKNNGYSGNSESHWKEYMTVGPSESPTYMMILRNGDPVPNIPGFMNQASVRDYVRNFVDPLTNTLVLKDNQAIYLYELGAPDLGHPSADFQDLVLLVSVADNPSYFLGGGEWVLYAVHITPRMLACIDPQTGAWTSLMSLANAYDGLAQAYDGKLYAIVKNAGLYIINRQAGTETLVGVPGYSYIEALEFAFGEGSPALDLTPQVPLSWTQQGALFAFDDNSNTFFVINPATGAAAPYNCAFQTVDCEGLVFFTSRSDPYGVVLADGCD